MNPVSIYISIHLRHKFFAIAAREKIFKALQCNKYSINARLRTNKIEFRGRFKYPPIRVRVSDTEASASEVFFSVSCSFAGCRFWRFAAQVELLIYENDERDTFGTNVPTDLLKILPLYYCADSRKNDKGACSHRLRGFKTKNISTTIFTCISNG